MPVVSMQPEGQLVGASLRVWVSLGVGPFSEGSLDEALGLAVGLWGVWLGANVPEPAIAAGVAEVERPVARAVVGHHPGNADAQALVVGQGCLEEGDGALFLLVGHDLAEGEARGVVDRDMDELPADASAVAVAGSVAGDAVADPVEAAELLDVDMDHLTRRFALVANDRRSRLQIPHTAEAETPQNSADRCRGNAGFLGDLLAGPALAAQAFNPLSSRLRGWPVQAIRPRGAIDQASCAFGHEAGDPLPDRFGRHPHGDGHSHRGLAFNQHPTHQLGSTVPRQARILMDVHPVPPWTLKLRNLSFLGQDRMDNLLRADTWLGHLDLDPKRLIGDTAKGSAEMLN